MSGWIKLYRQTLDNPVVCKDSDHLAVWSYLLLNATHKEMQVVFSGNKITLQPGQLITGRKVIGEKFNISESKVQRILKTFENEQQIEQQNGNKNRLITVLGWHLYQDSEQQIEQPVNNKRTTTEQQLNTNKNVRSKEQKNEKKNDIESVVVSYTSNPELIETIYSFIEHRKELKKPMTPRAVKMLFKEVDKISSEDSEKIAAIEQSIFKGWQGVFPLKDGGLPRGPKTEVAHHTPYQQEWAEEVDDAEREAALRAAMRGAM